jgi:hypothetical protein
MFQFKILLVPVSQLWNHFNISNKKRKAIGYKENVLIEATIIFLLAAGDNYFKHCNISL